MYYLQKLDLQECFDHEVLIEYGLLKYRFLTDENDCIEGIQCLHCNFSSYHPKDVNDLRCEKCNLNLAQNLVCE